MDKKINKKQAMKGIYEKLESIGHEATRELRKFDAATKSLLADAVEGVNRGEVDRDWIKKLERERKSQRVDMVKGVEAKMDEFQKEAEKTIDDIMMPVADELDADALEILKEFTVTTAEFEKMVRKYDEAGNISMLRKLDAYRKEHKIDTLWELHDGAHRKKALNSTIFGVWHGFDPQYHDDPDRTVTELVGCGYRALQGADQTAFALPETEPVQTSAEKLAANGIMMF